MNLNKLVDSLDDNEAKNLAKLLEKKVQKSAQEKMKEMLKQAAHNNEPISFYGQTRYVTGCSTTLSFYGPKIEFELDNGSKIVFDEVK